jgi:protein gp37
MAIQTAIEWTDTTWNPVSGCTKIGRGCDHCYAERIAERFRGTPGHPFANGFDLTLRPHKLTEPLSWRRPRRVFVNSMSDLFHKEIPRAFVDRVFDTMEQAHWHQFQVLTKRSSLLRSYVNSRYSGGHAPEHIWLGVSIEDRATLGRLKHLQQARAAVRFVSFEPLLEDLGPVDLSGIHWAIAGGESGAGAREIKAEWVRALRDQCSSANVAFFFKQWGGRTPKAGGNTLDGRRWQQYPRDIRPAV